MNLPDYNGDMNFQKFSTWISNKVIPNLPANSVIVMDNAFYHNKQVNRAPTMSSTKEDMITWLQNHDISYCDEYLKAELYQLIKHHKKPLQEFLIDKVIREAGHEVLHLPPNHPDLNPMEIIWHIIKERIAFRNNKLKLKDVKQLTEEEFAKISASNWKEYCDEVIEIEKKYFELDKAFDDIIEKSTKKSLVGIDTTTDDSCSSAESEDEDSDDDSDDDAYEDDYL